MGPDRLGPPLASGRAADVYALDDDRVLRRYRTDHDVATEAAVMRHAAHHGYPVPEVHDADGRDLVMDRIDGPTMLERMSRRPWELGRHARVLADLQLRLAGTPIPDLPLERVDLDGADVVLVHGDHHPANVILGRDGPVVIDWTNAHIGPRGSDPANAWCLIHGADAPDGGRIAALVVRAGRRRFLDAFLAASDMKAARRALPVIVELRQLDANLSDAEKERIGELLG